MVDEVEITPANTWGSDAASRAAKQQDGVQTPNRYAATPPPIPIKNSDVNPIVSKYKSRPPLLPCPNLWAASRQASSECPMQK
eukprot:463833-Pleurochrysis_carterae.AAC.2